MAICLVACLARYAYTARVECNRRPRRVASTRGASAPRMSPSARVPPCHVAIGPSLDVSHVRVARVARSASWAIWRYAPRRQWRTFRHLCRPMSPFAQFCQPLTGNVTLCHEVALRLWRMAISAICLTFFALLTHRMTSAQRVASAMGSRAIWAACERSSRSAARRAPANSPIT